MRSSAFFFTCVLSLLPSLSVTSTPDNVAVNDLPVFSSFKGPFFLRTQDNFNVILRYHQEIKSFVPVISHSKIRLNAFTLTDGNLTTRDESFSAFYDPVPAIFPPVLVPLRFGKGVKPDVGAGFVVVTKTRSGKETLELWALNGPIVVRQLSEEQPIFVKPEGNIDPTEHLHVEVVPVSKSQFNHVNHKDSYADQEFLDISDLK